MEQQTILVLGLADWMEVTSVLYASIKLSRVAAARPSDPTEMTRMEGFLIIAASAAVIVESSAGYFILQEERVSNGMLPAELPQTCVVSIPSASTP